MTNIAAALKAEITRISKKTVKADLAALRATNTSQRGQIAQLRAQVAELQRSVARLQKSLPTKTTAKTDEDGDKKSQRFSAKGLRSHRAKLGLSAQDYAKLVGASALSVYKWESEKAHPRQSQIQALNAVRELGKKAAIAKLNDLAGTVASTSA